MRELLYGITEIIARIHNYIMHMNDRFEYDFSDKDLHFLVIGILGMLMIFPVAYLCLKLGMLPRTVFIVHLLIEIIAQFVRVWVVCPMIKMNKHDYLINVIKPILKVSFCSSLVPIGLYLYLPSHLYSAVFIILSCPLCTLIMVYLNLSVVEKRILKRKYMLWIKSKRLSNIRF